MRKILLCVFVFFLLISFASAQTKVSFFYGNGCQHCAKVESSGVLEQIESLPNVTLGKYEIYFNDENRNLFLNYSENLGLKPSERGVPFAVIECENSSSYLLGDGPVIKDIVEKSKKCDPNSEKGNSSPSNPNAGSITLGGVIIAALVDSINPCAFGVLIFLMLSLLKIGSSKRALYAGLIYTFVVFIVYFLSGFGIFKIIQSFSYATHYIFIASGVLVLFAGIIEIKDFFWYGKGISLKIPSFAKPVIESFSSKGTIPAIIVLGIIVSLFELPCTGGLYLGILTMMSMNKSFAIGYLLLYNLIFVLPLIIMTIMIYKGTKPESLQNWNEHEKKWMRLFAGIVLVALGIYILLF